MVVCCRFFCFLLPNVVLGVVALGIKREPVLGVEVALGVVLCWWWMVVLVL